MTLVEISIYGDRELRSRRHPSAYVEAAACKTAIPIACFKLMTACSTRVYGATFIRYIRFVARFRYRRVGFECPIAHR